MRLRYLVLALALIGSVVTWHGATAQPAPQPLGQIISGADIGFRVESSRGRAAVGQLVVRVNGEWRETEFSMRMIPLKP